MEISFDLLPPYLIFEVRNETQAGGLPTPLSFGRTIGEIKGAFGTGRIGLLILLPH